MKKVYLSPVSEIIAISMRDVISTSLNSDQPHEGDPGWNTPDQD